MIHVVDARLSLEIERCALAFTCERCAQFDPSNGRCSAGYPNEDHREKPIEVGARLVFCKEFELA